MTVRTRIAPSPTGEPHVGTAYIALFNMVFAKSQGGEFILRIEDTDQVRSTQHAEGKIIDCLRWLGLTWDEGPDCGGPCGPYRQSERKSLYQQYAQQLLDNKRAFPCFCTPERLQALREQQSKDKTMSGYDGHCLHLAQTEIETKMAAGTPFVIRLKVPQEGQCHIDDMLRGKITFDWSQVDMQVLVKADGMPTYHLANVVDDHLMGITHVIRGEEWISSAPKHWLLYQCLGWQMPQLCHMPLLRNTDKSKLSKRKNPTSIAYYRDMGFLPEALVNYLGRMGWSMPDEREQFTLDEMIAQFDLARVSLGGPVFDQAKLSWLNGRWIRDNLTDQQFAQRISSWMLQDRQANKILPFVKERVETFADMAHLSCFMFSGLLQLSPADFAHKKLTEQQIKQLLQCIVWRLETITDWDAGTVFAAIKSLADSAGYKIGDCMQPVFVAMAGSAHSWSVVDSMAILGADISRARLRHAISVLGGLSKKEIKRLEKNGFLPLSSADLPA